MPDMTTHPMLDAINLANLNAHASEAEALAGYVNGRWPTYPELVTKYGKSDKLLLSIDVSGDPALGAQTLDIESGDATIAMAPAWFKDTQAAGMQARDLRWYPKLYTSISNGASLVDTMDAAKVKRDEYMIWSAHFTGVPHICGPKSCGAAIQADATQWTDAYHGIALDASEYFGYFFSGPPAKPPKRKSGPVRHVADGTVSLDTALAKAKLGLTTTIETSAKHLSYPNLRKFTAYLAKGTGSKMGRGLVYWTAR